MKVKSLIFWLGFCKNHIKSAPNCIKFCILSFYIFIESLEALLREKDRIFINFPIYVFFMINFHKNNIKHPLNIDFMLFNLKLPPPKLGSWSQSCCTCIIYRNNAYEIINTCIIITTNHEQPWIMLMMYESNEITCDIVCSVQKISLLYETFFNKGTCKIKS